ncbi:MAG TPA: MarR family transcriptional regulator [Gemmatimonadales bacterium]|jgi:DNA-binding MarR family transcriptional regulator|nr:MarR family transcriptional regulator [Gemmatimonadales bacterium]
MGRRTTPRGWRDTLLRTLEALPPVDPEERAADKQRRDLLHRKSQHARRELLDEILATARRVAAARNMDGERIIRTDPAWRLLTTIERAPYCCSISDAARLLRLSRQRVHHLARQAEQLGLIELEPNPDDRRILQLFLTESGRARLAAARSVETAWLNVLLNGLDDRRLAVTVHVLSVIGQRLVRDAQAARTRSGR